MVDVKRNTWSAKFVRFINSFLPVDKNRVGKCKRCGECCKLPVRCPFLRYKNKKAKCLIYPFRPRGCKTYPRVDKEHITKDTCGFRFK